MKESLFPAKSMHSIYSCSMRRRVCKISDIVHKIDNCSSWFHRGFLRNVTNLLFSFDERIFLQYIKVVSCYICHEMLINIDGKFQSGWPTIYFVLFWKYCSFNSEHVSLTQPKFKKRLGLFWLSRPILNNPIMIADNILIWEATLCLVIKVWWSVYFDQINSFISLGTNYDISNVWHHCLSMFKVLKAMCIKYSFIIMYQKRNYFLFCLVSINQKSQVYRIKINMLIQQSDHQSGSPFWKSKNSWLEQSR